VPHLLVSTASREALLQQQAGSQPRRAQSHNTETRVRVRPAATVPVGLRLQHPHSSPCKSQLQLAAAAVEEQPAGPQQLLA
jgi:hypothetical protein